MLHTADAAVLAMGIVAVLASVYLWSTCSQRRDRAAYLLRLLLRTGTEAPSDEQSRLTAEAREPAEAIDNKPDARDDQSLRQAHDDRR